jgi:type 1 glutamine amidotransferase
MYPIIMAFACAACATTQDLIPTLLITGANNHNWQYTSRLHADTLEATGRFVVTITDNPGMDLARPGALDRFRLIVLDYNADNRWPAQAEENFIRAVQGGTGLVAIHASNNAFPTWAEFERMLALVWRSGTTGHGRFHEFSVEPVDDTHAIMRGLGAFGTTDELYHRLVNPQETPYRLLARAMSTVRSGGSGELEPMALTVEYGSGRVFATPLGHVWTGQDATKASVVSPGFRALLARGAEWAATGSVTLPPEWRDVRNHNTLRDTEQREGWRLLFDGRTTGGWVAWRDSRFPSKGWRVEDGCLFHAAGEGGGDIATVDTFGDFELSIEWRVAPGGNSGIFYRCVPGDGPPWRTGPEFQVLDDLRHNDGRAMLTRAGCMYAIAAAAFDTARPAMEWNHTRIVCRGTRIEHYLNGFKVVDVDTASEDFARAVRESKFRDMPGFGTSPRGHIVLQDHGDSVWFRNIRIREW